MALMPDTIITLSSFGASPKYDKAKVKVSQFQFFDNFYNIMRGRFKIPLTQILGLMVAMLYPTRVL